MIATFRKTELADPDVVFGHQYLLHSEVRVSILKSRYHLSVVPLSVSQLSQSRIQKVEHHR